MTCDEEAEAKGLEIRTPGVRTVRKTTNCAHEPTKIRTSEDALHSRAGKVAFLYNTDIPKRVKSNDLYTINLVELGMYDVNVLCKVTKFDRSVVKVNSNHRHDYSRQKKSPANRYKSV